MEAALPEAVRDSMAEESDIVVLETANNYFVAQMIAEALKSHGIAAYVEGISLIDEFAMSQKAMGLTSVDIQVHRDRLDEAREILAAMREAGKLMEEGGEED